MLMSLVGAVLHVPARADDGNAFVGSTADACDRDEHHHPAVTWQLVHEDRFYLQSPPGSLTGAYLNHIGDIDYHDGIIYVSLNTTAGYTNGHVALYSASDLSYTC
jgi:hypothetical protein